MIKILYITSSFPRSAGDYAGNFVFELASKIKKQGFSIHVLAPHEQNAQFQENFDGLRVTRFPYFYPPRFQCLAYKGGISSNIAKSRLALLQIPLFFLSELACTVFIIFKDGINVTHSHWLIPQGLVGAICKKFFGVSHIATIHSSEVTLIKKIPYGRAISEFILNNSDAIVSVSSHRAKELLLFISPGARARIKEKVSIIPMGVYVNEFNINKNREELKSKYNLNFSNIILFVGRLVEVKGCEYLIKGFKEVLDKGKDATLIIVGNGPLEAKLKDMARALHIEDRVRFEGFIEHRKVIDYYTLSDIVVFSSIVDPQGFNEGLPLVLLETMATGKPIISTNIDGAREVIRDGWNGMLVEQKNSRQITENILKLLNDSALKAKFSANALKTATDYDWDVIARKYAHVIEDRLKKYGRRTVVP